MYIESDSPEQHSRRSDFIKKFVQNSEKLSQAQSTRVPGCSPSIVQFWHDPLHVPTDVQECIESWRRWTAHGFTHQVFDFNSAGAFITRALGPIHKRAFERCYHPAMQSDYFRLCYLYVKGGLYVDADDVCVADNIDCLLSDKRLKIQPLCYDLDVGDMVETSRFLEQSEATANWIFYFNNNPLAAGSKHPVIAQALERATTILHLSQENTFPEIQETTGPGNLSKVIFEMGLRGEIDKSNLDILRSWETIAISKWPLSYRSDSRNWRRSNRQKFFSSEDYK